MATASPLHQELEHEKLRLETRRATFGHWRSLRNALRGCDSATRQIVEVRITRLLNGSVRRFRTYFVLDLIENSLPVAVGNLSSTQLTTALDLAIGMTKRGFVPNDVLRLILPALFRALQDDESMSALDLAFQLVHYGVNPSCTLQSGVLAAATALNRQQFAKALVLASHQARFKIDPCMTLLEGLPAVARALSPEKFDAALSLAEDMSSHSINPALTLTKGLPAAARHLTQDQLPLALTLARDMATHSVNPCSTLEVGLPAVTTATADASCFAAAVELARRMAERGMEPSEVLRSGIPALVQYLPSESLAESSAYVLKHLSDSDIQTASERSIYASMIIPAAARSSASAQDFDLNILAVKETLAILPNSSSLSPVLAYLSARGANSSEFRAGLAELRRLVAKLKEENIQWYVRADLLCQALVIKEQYEDYLPRYHPAVTHMSTADDYQNGGWVTIEQEVTDHPSWIELRPYGRRIADLSIEEVDQATAQTLLEGRSWLWQYLVEESFRDRARYRMSCLVAFVPVIVERLCRQGVLPLTSSICSVYLIGSYLWTGAPNDIDLFILVDGSHDFEIFRASVLREFGVEVHELNLPLSIEIAGRDTLLAARSGQAVPNQKRLARRFTLLYGSLLLAGQDLFANTDVTTAELEELHKDLNEDRERAQWPDLAADRAKVTGKKAWRQLEMNSLAQFTYARRPPTVSVVEPTLAREPSSRGWFFWKRRSGS
jgi:hypothetical protein